MSEIAELLQKILTEIRVSNEIQNEALKVQKEYIEEWREKLKAFSSDTGEGVYRAISEALQRELDK